jgi:Immunity protein family (Imm11)
MNVYILDADVNKYRGIHYINEEDVVAFNRRFDGRSIKRKWSGREKFAFVPRRMPKGDTPGLSSHIPVFSSKALTILGDFLKASGEVLQISCDAEKYFLFNVTRLVDALDEAKCELQLFNDGGIMDIVRYSFLKEKLIDVVIFKLPQDPLGWVYTTDPFVDRVQAAGLKGFKFRLVWSSD